MCNAFLLVAYIVMTILEETKDAMLTAVYFFRILPNFAFGESIANLMVRVSVLYVFARVFFVHVLRACVRVFVRVRARACVCVCVCVCKYFSFSFFGNIL